MTDSESENSSSSSDSDSDSENAPVEKPPKSVLKQSSMPAVRHFEANRDKGETINGGECATDCKSGDADGKTQNEVHFANKQRGGDTVACTDEKQPTTRKSGKERGIHNKAKQLATDQHVHDAVSGNNNGRPMFNNHGDKTVITAEEKSSHHVERRVQTTPHADSIVHGVFHKSTDSRKVQGRRARRQKSKNRSKS